MINEGLQQRFETDEERETNFSVPEYGSKSEVITLAVLSVLLGLTIAWLVIDY